MIEWEATDNFGNLMVAKSDADSVGELRADLQSLVEEALHRTPVNAVFAVDAAYAEIAAPDGSAVTHILQVPLLTQLSAKGQSKAEIEQAIISELTLIIAALPECGARAQGPWEF